MNIVFLGTGRAIPEPNRRNTCTMLEIGGHYYFVDMGTAANEMMATRGIPVSAVNAVFLTHMHGDHANGVIAFADLLTWCYKKEDPLIYLPMIEAAEIINAWTNLQTKKSRTPSYREVVSGKIYDAEGVCVTAIPTKHGPKTYAFLFEAEEKRVLFTGDLKNPNIDFPQVDGQLDMLVCEAAHFSPMEYLPVLEKLPVKQVCIHHYAPQYIGDIYRLADSLPGVQITIATDDLELRI